MATIQLPQTLVRFSNGDPVFASEAVTLGDALIELMRAYPPLRSQLFDENLRLRVYVNIYLNKESVRLPDDFNAPVTQKSVIRILQSVAGG